MKYFFVLYLFYSPLLSGQQRTTIEVMGKLKGNYAGKIFLFFDDNYSKKDSINSEIQNGNFYFKCNVRVPVLGRIHLGQTSSLIDFYIDEKRTYLDCTNNMIVRNSGKDTFNMLTIDTVRGSKMEQIRRSFFESVHVTEPREIYNKDTVEYFNKLNAFVKQHSKSKVAPYLISFSSNLSYYPLHALYQQLDTSLNNTFEMKGVIKLLERKERHKLELLKEGMPFYDISLTNIDDKQINTKDLAGDYFLIICWTSGCAPCRKKHPILIDMYNNYKDRGLTMVGISFDRSKSKWINAVKQDKILWTQLIDINGFRGDFGKYYGIEGVPMLFLLDKNRRIINTGSLQEIQRKIETLIQ